MLQGKWEVPLPKVKGMSETEVFKVIKSGKTRRKLALKKVVLNMPCFYERYLILKKNKIALYYRNLTIVFLMSCP
jgi:ribosome biogenesis protein NSA2